MIGTVQYLELFFKNLRTNIPFILGISRKDRKKYEINWNNQKIS